MAKIYGSLEAANMEQLASDPTGVGGRFYFNTGSLLPRFYNGTSWANFDGGGGSSAAYNVRATEGGGTTVLINADNKNQLFTLSAAHAVELPTTGVLAGDIWVISSTTPQFNLGVYASDSSLIQLINSGPLTLVALINTPVTNSDWLIKSQGELYSKGSGEAPDGTQIGFEIISTVTTPTNITTSATDQDLASISLPVGVYDVSAGVYYAPATAVMTGGSLELLTWINMTGFSGYFGITYFGDFDEQPATWNYSTYTLPTLRIRSDGTNLYCLGQTMSSTTTVKLTGKLTAFSSGNPVYQCVLRAVKVT